MSSQRFIIGTRFTWKGVTYEVRRVLPEGKLNIEDLYTGAQTIVELQELVNALFAEELSIARRANEAGQKTREPIALDDYPGDLVDIAHLRLEIIRPIVALPLRERTRAVVQARAKQFDLGTATLYRWIKLYLDSDCDIRSLIPGFEERGGAGESRLVEVEETITDGVIREKYLVREKVTVKDVWIEVGQRIREENQLRNPDAQLKCPSQRTIYRRIDKLGMMERFMARHGKKAAKRALSQYGASQRATHPLERVEFDHTRTDFIVVDDEDHMPLGRLNLTAGYCTATGYPFGYYMGFEPPSVYSLMECMYHGICPKPDVRTLYNTEHLWLAHGVPFATAVDNGKDFLSGPFRDACGALGIQLMQMAVGEPHLRGGIERFFRTIDTGLWHGLPGSTFSNPTKRGDYNSMEQACIYLSEVDKLLHIFLLDVYAEDYHRGLNGIPARLWENAVGAQFSPRVPDNIKDLRILLGRAEMRVVHHYGVELENLLYNHPDLAPLRAQLKGEPTKIRFHPGDLSKISVFDPFEQRYIDVLALAQDYTRGLSLWKHKVILNYLHTQKEKVDIESLARAKRKIQEIVANSSIRKRAGNRSRAARWKTAGKPSRELTPGSDSESSSPQPVVDQASVQDLEMSLLGIDRSQGWSVEFSDDEEAHNG